MSLRTLGPRSLAYSLVGAFVGVALLLALPARSQSVSMSFIRDAETEATIRRIALPIFEAAGLNPKSVQVILINDRQINAFVAAGQRIFIFTGLLLRVETPNQLAGVIAHETGHIAGGHLARSEDAIRSASATQIAAMLLGAAAMVAGGGAAGPAVMSLGNQAAERSFLAYSRVQESSADQAAVTYLNRVGASSEGLLQFLKILGDQEALLSSRQDPYMRTHPVSAERISLLKTRADESRFHNVPDDPDLVDALKRVQAKLRAYTEPSMATLRRYPTEDGSIHGHYARAITFHRIADAGRTADEVDAILKLEPNNPYFLEFKGQTLYERGLAAQGLPYIEKAVQLRPDEPQFQQLYAQILTAVGGKDNSKRAVEALKEVTRIEPDNPSAWRDLSMAYGQLDDIAMASYTAGEWYFLIGDFRGANLQVERALKMLPKGSPAWLRASDLSGQLQVMLKQQR